MEGKTASIAFCKMTGEFGPRKFLEPNKLFIIGTDTGSDIRLYNMTKFVRHVFELDEDGMVTLTDDTLPIDDPSRRRAFTASRESFVVEGRTFSVDYLNPDEVVAAANSTDSLQTQRKQRHSSIATFGGRNIQEPGDTQFVTRRKSPSKYSTADEPIREPLTPRRPSTSVESIVIPTPVTPIPAFSTPSARRFVFQRQSMVTLAEEDESNSNDSKYKTPENATSPPQIIMRSHKSTIKYKLDGDSTPKCITPSSNNKSRRSLLVCSDSKSLNKSPNTSDDESSEKGDITITTTSTSASEDENVDSVNADDEINADYNPQVVRQVAKRFRTDDEYDDQVQEESIEPPKKRMRRDSAYSFRDKSIADSRNIDTAIISKKQVDTFSSFADISASAQEMSSRIIAPSTVPRVNKRLRRSASSSQRLSRRSMPSISPLETDLSNQENMSFQDNFSIFFSTKSKSPIALLNHEKRNDSNTTESSSFTYVRGEEIEPVDLGMSVFASEQNDTVRVFGNDLMRFSDVSYRNTPLKSVNKDTFPTTPDKLQIESNSSTGRRSSRVIRPKMVYTPEQSILPARTPKKTPAKRDILQIDSTELIGVSSLINNSLMRKSSHPQTPTADVRENFRRHSSVNRTPKNIPKAASLDDESPLLSNTSNKSKKSCTPARINKGATLVVDSDFSSSTQQRKTFSSPLRQHSIQINHCNTSLINDCLLDTNASTAKKNRRTSKRTVSIADESFTEVRENSRTRTSLTPRLLKKNTSLIKNASFDHNKNSIKKTLRTPKNSARTPAKTSKSALLTYDSDDSFVEVRKSICTLPLPKIPAIAILIEDYSEGNIHPVDKRPRTPGRTSRTPTKQTKNIDACIESDDSFIENKSTPYPRSYSNKKNIKLYPYVDNSLLFGPSPIANLSRIYKSRTETPDGGNTSKALVDTNTNTKSTNLFRDSLLEPPAVRRSTRTPKSIFGTNSTLDETIFDTSTKQTHSNRSMSDLTGKSMSRSVSMGDSLSRNASKNSAVFDDSLVVSKITPSKLSRSLIKRSLSVGVLKPLDDSTTKCGRSKSKIHVSPINNLTNIQGVKRMFRTPKVVKQPKDDLTNLQGIKQLYCTPKLQKGPKNDLSDLRGVGKLMTTCKPRNEPRNELSNFKGVRNMFKSPSVPSGPKNDLTNVTGVKTLFRIPKIQTQPKNDLSDLRGVKALLGTPKKIKEPLNDLSDFRGVKQLFRTPKEPKLDLSDFTGVKQLLTLPKRTKSPKTNVGGVKQLSMSTPKIIMDPINDLTDVAAVKKILKTSMAKNADYTDELGEASVTSTTSFLPPTIELPVKKTRARRGKAQAIETYEEPVYSQRQTRARRIKTPVEQLVVDLTLSQSAPKARTTRRKVVVQEVKEALDPSTTPRTTKRISKQNREPMSTQDEIVDEPVQQSRARNTRRRVATAKVEELVSEDETQQKVSSTISTKSKTTTRKRGMVQEIVEEDEPVLKKTRVKVTKSNQKDGIDVQKTGLKKPRARKTKIIPNEEVVPDVVSIQKTRGRKKKPIPVLDEVDGDTVFTSVENIVDKAAGRAVRVTRTRRGYAESNQTEESYDIESVDNLTTVKVRKTTKAKPTATKRVQFDIEDDDTNIKNSKRPKSRRLLSVDDIDSMVEEPKVVNRVRKSARSRK